MYNGRLMRAVEANLGHSLQYWGRGIEVEGLTIPCARSTRGRGLPSFDARTVKIFEAPLVQNSI